MSSEKKTITLGGEEFEILVPLTIGQLEDLRVAVVFTPPEDPVENVRYSAKRERAILLAAMPDMTEEKLLATRAFPREMNAAVSAILVGSGLIVPRDPATGEAQAEASTGAA